ncbi:SRPBCC family protein [Nocardia terpenica]|uniref:type II toxin-antitoxin system Rv0910 family toxin n=1 Tax=Nocardia terpenica TaxID=455432 RepID=UPI002FE22DEC
MGSASVTIANGCRRMRWVRRTSGGLPAAQGEVWALVSDLARYGEWLPWHDRWLRELPKPLLPGRCAVQQVTVFGSIHTIEWTITELAPPSDLRLATLGQHGLLLSFTTQVRPIDDGRSAVTLEVQLDGPMLDRVGTFAIESVVADEFEKALSQLDKLVSGGC